MISIFKWFIQHFLDNMFLQFLYSLLYCWWLWVIEHIPSTSCVLLALKVVFLEEIFSTGCFSGEIWLIAVGHPWKTFPEGRSRISDDTEICSSLFWHKNNYSNQQTIDITIALTGIIKSSFCESALWRAWIIVTLV